MTNLKADSLVNILPVPQIAERKGGAVVLGKAGASDVQIIWNAGDDDFLRGVKSRFEQGLFKKIGGYINDESSSVAIVFELSEDVPKEVKANHDQAYMIEASNSGITLTGYGKAGLNYAATTLLQIVSEENNVISVPECTILDWPDMKTRGHFMECRFGSNLMTYKDWTGLVDDMARMKMNQLVVALYGCWCVQFDGVISEYAYVPIKKYPKIETDVISRYYSPRRKEWIHKTESVPMASEDFFGDLIAYGKKLGVEVLPLWNSLGHNTLIPRMYPEVSAIVDGKTSGYGFCVSNEQTYTMLFDIFDEIITRYLKPNGITSFHIGMDEVVGQTGTDLNDLFKFNSPWCTCEKCLKVSNEDKFLNHALKLIKYLKAKGMESVYIYSDMMTNVIDPVRFKNILAENDLLDTVVIDWWTYTNHPEKKMFQTMHPELGLRSTIKPWNSYFHWNFTFDSVPNVYDLVSLAKKEGGRAEGLQSYSAWDKSCDRNHVSMADYSWNFDGTGSVFEYNDRYAMREFGKCFYKARYALDLMDKITEEDGTEEAEEKAKGTFMLEKLAYYYFAYVNEGKPYPRNFPGEAMSNIFEKRGFYEKSIREISDMAREARSIFEEISKEHLCNTTLAERYMCENENYLCIADDYLALLEIHDIMQEEVPSADKAERIARIAGERKNARLSLMNRIEHIKEAFLIPSHLRIQSIFMQMFADIEAYAVRCMGKDIQLNIFNMNDVMSSRFFSLR